MSPLTKEMLVPLSMFSFVLLKQLHNNLRGSAGAIIFLLKEGREPLSNLRHQC